MITKKYNIEFLSDESTRDYTTRLKKHIADNRVEEEDSVDASWIKSNIHEASKEGLGHRRVGKGIYEPSKP